MKAPKKSNPSKTESPLFPSLFKAKTSGTTGKSSKFDPNFKQTAGNHDTKGFRPASLIRKGRAGT